LQKKGEKMGMKHKILNDDFIKNLIKKATGYDLQRNLLEVIYER
jgi:hypothetical protein